MAMILPECYQQVVNHDPVLGGKLTSKYSFSLIRIFGRNISQSVTYAVDMDIYANARFTEAERHDKVGCFTTDPFEFEEFIDVVRNCPVIVLNQF